MILDNYPTKDIFSHVHNNILRWALKDYQMSKETSTRGGYLSWLTIAYDIICSPSNDLDFPDLTEEQEQRLDQLHSLKKIQRGEDTRAHDDTGWPITRNKLERFVDGEKSRSTKFHKRQTPEVWLRCVIRDFLREQGRLPEYFHEPELEQLFPAFALVNYFLTGQQKPHEVLAVDFTGTYQGRKKAEEENRPRRLGLHLVPQGGFYEVEESSFYKIKSESKTVRGAGWAILLPFEGMLVFLQDKIGEMIVHRLYIAHSIGFNGNQLTELTLLPYQGQATSLVQFDQSVKKGSSKSLFFIKEMPDSFDRIPISVKGLKKRTPRGEAALKIDYDVDSSSREEKMSEKNIDGEFQCAAVAGELAKVEELIDSVVDINLPMGGAGGTVLHVIAECQLIDVFNVIRKRPDLNYLVKDNEGKLPSQWAMNSYEDVGLGTFLKRKEMQQARREGIDYRLFAMGTNSKTHFDPAP